LLSELSHSGPQTVGQLIAALGVTATAVRQRLVRLLALGYVERTAVTGMDRMGRGRPSYQYRLTDKGRRLVGHNLDDLACVLWEEVQRIDDAETRAAVIRGVVRRLAEQYANQVSGQDLAERLRSIGEILHRRQIGAAVEQREGLPVLKVVDCPYPSLADADGTICKLEAELLSRLSGREVHLDTCRRDGGNCCVFSAAHSEHAPSQAIL